MKRLITGSSGFIGSHLKKALPDAVGLDIVPWETTDIVEDICDFKSNEHWDVIYHFAALVDMEQSVKDPVETFRNNICGTVNILKLHYNLLVFASSVGVHNPSLNPYSLSKFVCEEMIKASDKPYVIFRLANVYGEGSKSVVQKFLNNSTMEIYGDGEQVRDFAYIDDLIKYLVQVDNIKKNAIHYVGTGVATSINDLAKFINEIQGNKHTIHTEPRKYEIRKPIIKADLRCEIPLVEGIRRCLRRNS